jgi:hypothetical protein
MPPRAFEDPPQIFALLARSPKQSDRPNSKPIVDQLTLAELRRKRCPTSWNEGPHKDTRPEPRPMGPDLFTKREARK